MKPLYQRISTLLAAIENCKTFKNEVWESRHEAALEELLTTHMPSGSGFDSGVKILDSTPEKLRFSADFHHMSGQGSYDGWTQHIITVTPSLQFGINIKISGTDKNSIKDYIHEVFSHSLYSEICQEEMDEAYKKA